MIGTNQILKIRNSKKNYLPFFRFPATVFNVSLTHREVAFTKRDGIHRLRKLIVTFKGNNGKKGEILFRCHLGR